MLRDGKQSSTNISDSVECSSIESGIDLFNSHISRIVNLSQCKVIIISEDLASEGVFQYIATFSDNIEMSPHANIIISKSSASDFIDSSDPILEDLASRYYDLVTTSNTYSGYTKSVSLIEFFSDYYDTFSQPSASLGFINSQNDTSKLEIMGMTVFNKDKLVGELSIWETICHMIISNELNSCKVQVPNPLDNGNSTIDVELKLDKNTKNSVNFINNSPYIKTNISLQVKILSVGASLSTGQNSYISKNNLPILEKSLNQYLTTQIEKYLYKICKEYNCDIDSFGKYAVKHFATTSEWQEYNWLSNFKNSFFDVYVNTTIKSGYSFM